MKDDRRMEEEGRLKNLLEQVDSVCAESGPFFPVLRTRDGTSGPRGNNLSRCERGPCCI